MMENEENKKTLEAKAAKVVVNALFTTFKEANECCQAVATLQNKNPLVKINTRRIKSTDDQLKDVKDDLEYYDLYLRCICHGKYSSQATIVKNPKESLKCLCPMHVHLTTDTEIKKIRIKAMNLNHNDKCNETNKLDEPTKPKATKKKKSQKGSTKKMRKMSDSSEENQPQETHPPNRNRSETPLKEVGNIKTSEFSVTDGGLHENQSKADNALPSTSIELHDTFGSSFDIEENREEDLGGTTYADKNDSLDNDEELNSFVENTATSTPVVGKKNREEGHHLKDVVFELTAERGRPPGRDSLTAIGLPMTPTVQMFGVKPLSHQNLTLLIWLNEKDKNVIKNVYYGEYKFTINDVTSWSHADIRDIFLIEDFGVQYSMKSLSRYFDEPATFARFESLVNQRKVFKEENNEQDICPLCMDDVESGCISCDSCCMWIHYDCEEIENPAQYDDEASKIPYFCKKCNNWLPQILLK